MSHLNVTWGVAPSENRTSTPFSPLEELPDEMFGKILAWLPDLVDEVGTAGISAAIDCKKQLEMTSKKIYLAVNSPRCAALFMQAIWEKYGEPKDNFTCSELALVKGGVWDRVGVGSMHRSFEVREEEIWAPLEALPDEILRKIVTLLTEVQGEEGSTQVATWRESDVDLRKKEMQQTIRSQINLGLASKRLYKVVHDGYTKRLFVHAVIDKYQMLDFGLFVREVGAVREGVWDYIRAYRLEKSFELTQRVCRLASDLVKVVNQRLNRCEMTHGEFYIYDFLPRGFEIHSHSDCLSLDFSPHKVRIYCPLVALAIRFDEDWTVPTAMPVCHAHPPFLILLEVFEALVRFFGATFVGIRSRHTDGPDEPFSWPDLSYFEVCSRSQNLSLLRTVSWEEMIVLDRFSAWERRGSGNLIMCPSPHFRSLYQVRSPLGGGVSEPTINGSEVSPELIRLVNVIHLTLERTRPLPLLKHRSLTFEEEP